jgi:hypothetical protein
MRRARKRRPLSLTQRPGNAPRLTLEAGQAGDRGASQPPSANATHARPCTRHDCPRAPKPGPRGLVRPPTDTRPTSVLDAHTGRYAGERGSGAPGGIRRVLVVASIAAPAMAKPSPNIPPAKLSGERVASARARNAVAITPPNTIADVRNSAIPARVNGSKSPVASIATAATLMPMHPTTAMAQRIQTAGACGEADVRSSVTRGVPRRVDQHRPSIAGRATPAGCPHAPRIGVSTSSRSHATNVCGKKARVKGTSVPGERTEPPLVLLSRVDQLVRRLTDSHARPAAGRPDRAGLAVTAAITAAISVPLHAAGCRSVPLDRAGEWGGLRGSNP